MTVTDHESVIEIHNIPPNNGAGARTSVMKDMSWSYPAEEEQTRTQHLFELKKEARRLRQSLKESGDFLGVQGVNPETGEMDVLTPTSSSNSTMPLNLSPRLGGLAQRVKDSRQAYREAKEQHKTELQRAQSRREREKLEKFEREKEAIRSEQQKVKWRKEAGQWSSVAEPNLSPIAQSQGSGTGCKLPSHQLFMWFSANLTCPASERPPSSYARSVSQNYKPPPPAFVENPGHVSSETIIHTPSRHDSPNSESPATEAALHNSLAGSPASKENHKDSPPGILKKSEGCHRIPSVGRKASVCSPNGSSPARRCSQELDMAGEPKTTPQRNSQESFLGQRPPILTDPGGHAEDLLTGTSRWTVATGHRGHSKGVEQGSGPDTTGGGPSLQQLVRDGLEQTRAHLEDLHPTTVLSRVGQTYNPALPTFERDPPHEGTASPLRPKTVQFRIPPTAPQRRNSGRRETVIESDAPYRAGDPDPRTPVLRPRIGSLDGVSRLPSPSLVDEEPSEEWADTLIQDTDLVSRAPETASASAFIPTITTTGYGLGPPSLATAGYDGPADPRGGRAVATATAFGAPVPSTKEGSVRSLSRTTPSDWLSADGCPATATSATMSSRQLTPTKLRTESLSPKACYHRPGSRESSSSPPEALGRTKPFCHLNGHPRGEVMAQGAAQAALNQAGLAMSRRGPGGPGGGALAATPRSRGASANGGTGGPFRTAMTGSTTGPPSMSRSRTPGPVQRAGNVMVTALWTYWQLIQPVFDGRSLVRRRLSEGKPTWPDVTVCALAGVFSVLALVAGIWAIRVLLFTASLFKMAVRALGLLLGI